MDDVFGTSDDEVGLCYNRAPSGCGFWECGFHICGFFSSQEMSSMLKRKRQIKEKEEEEEEEEEEEGNSPVAKKRKTSSKVSANVKAIINSELHSKVPTEPTC